LLRTVDIGVSGPPFRAGALAVGAAIAAEADGAQEVWYPADVPEVPEPVWREAAGPLAAVVPDPSDVADPVVTAAAAALVTRRLRVGILGWTPGADAARAARTVATLADLAPGRVVLALTGPATEIRALAGAGRAALPVELLVVDDGALAADLGWRVLAVATRPGRGCGGVHLAAYLHPDPGVAKEAADADLPRRLGLDGLAAGPVAGDATALEAAIDELAAAGVPRVVVEPAIGLGAPEELDAGRNELRVAIRRARLKHRCSSP
jgi:hypothetical protein